jgi:hypothetical protein
MERKSGVLIVSTTALFLSTILTSHSVVGDGECLLVFLCCVCFQEGFDLRVKEGDVASNGVVVTAA